MALVTMVSGDHQKGMGIVAEVGPDAAIVAGADGAEGLKSLAESLSGVPWGARVSSLSEDEAQAYQQSGSDLLAFPLENTTASALGLRGDGAHPLHRFRNGGTAVFGQSLPCPSMPSWCP